MGLHAYVPRRGTTEGLKSRPQHNLRPCNSLDGENRHAVTGRPVRRLAVYKTGGMERCRRHNEYCNSKQELKNGMCGHAIGIALSKEVVIPGSGGVPRLLGSNSRQRQSPLVTWKQIFTVVLLRCYYCMLPRLR